MQAVAYGAKLTRFRYSDDEFEYRHVQLPKAMLKAIPSEYHDKSKGTLKLLWEDEWRVMGITQVRSSCRVVNSWRGGS
jgi:cyclin-dependent kinase regulatory subunit CKS1